MQAVSVIWDAKLWEVYILRHLKDSDVFLVRWFNHPTAMPEDWEPCGPAWTVSPAWLRRHKTTRQMRVCNLCNVIPCNCDVTNSVPAEHPTWLPCTESLKELREEVAAQSLEDEDVADLAERNKPYGVLDVGLLNEQECYSLLGRVSEVDQSEDRLNSRNVNKSKVRLLSRAKPMSAFERE